MSLASVIALLLEMKTQEWSKCFRRVSPNGGFKIAILSHLRPCLFFRAALLEGKFTTCLETYSATSDIVHFSLGTNV